MHFSPCVLSTFPKTKFPRPLFPFPHLSHSYSENSPNLSYSTGPWGGILSYKCMALCDTCYADSIGLLSLRVLLSGRWSIKGAWQCWNHYTVSASRFFFYFRSILFGYKSLKYFGQIPKLTNFILRTGSGLRTLQFCFAWCNADLSPCTSSHVILY